MESSLIRKKIQNLTVWKRNGERAPHKPLLILYALGRLWRNSERLIPYEEIDEKLKELLVAFGPCRARHHPEFPFWRLRNDQVWELSGAENLKATRSGDVSRKELIKQQVYGGFPEDIFSKLKESPYLVREIVTDLLNDNFPSSIHEDILQSMGIDLETDIPSNRRRDPDFRERVLRAYEYKCAICGFDVRIGHYPVALEAAHIKWYQAGGPDIEVNGLALCTLHHKLFDRGAFTLSESLNILVSDRANGTIGFNEWLMKFHGKKLNHPQRKNYLPFAGFREWHVREVFQGHYREINLDS